MKKTEPILQVALDFMDLGRAANIAKEAVDGGADWIEAGTPLIKSEGLDAVREFRRLFPGRRIVADMKVMDTGRFEIEAAAKAGASIVTVLGVADDATVKEAVDAARNLGCQVMVDLMGVEDNAARAKEVETLGVDYVCVHLSIDAQMKGLNAISELDKVCRNVKIPVAVAGGINSETAASAVAAGASIVIVGGAIAKAEDATKAASIIKKAMLSGKKVDTTLYKKYTDPLKAFRNVSTANISDAMHRSGQMEGLREYSPGKIVGTAVTVRTYPGDWAKPVEAIDVAKEGDVIVVDAGGSGIAVWGELASQSCITKKLAGVVIDGALRDLEDIKKIKFPAYAKHVTPTAGEPRGLGEINVPVKCGGVLVRPGDYVIADGDGIVVVPKERAVEVANRALDVMERENRIRGEIKRGSTLSKVMELKKWEKREGCV